MANKGFSAIWFGTDSPVFRSINGAWFINNGDDTHISNGLEVVNGGSVGMTISNCIFYGNTGQNLRISDTGNVASISNCTFANQGAGHSPIWIDPAITNPITITDSIVAGNGTSDVDTNALFDDSTAGLTISGVALVQSGPFSLAAPTAGSAPLTGTPSTTDDPAFSQIADLTAAHYFDVTNTAYATANSSSGPLGGGADYIGSSSVAGWSMY